MKKQTTTLLLACACAFPLFAQTPILQPTPQEITTTGKKIVLPKSVEVMLNITDSYLQSTILENGFPVLTNSKGKKCKIIAGVRGDKALKKFEKLIPEKKEGYYLEVTEKQIVIAANDNRGLFYGFQTLNQLTEGDSLTLATITDYPDIEFRGVVEGFYGTPWSHHARLRQLKFYGENKLNTYIYGPKDDPYHSSPHWRDPYPENEAAQLKELVTTANQNGVDFVWAIHPGKDIKWNEEDRNNLMKKFEYMYDLGIRSYAVFFDDIWGEGTNPARQAELLNYIDDNFVKIKGDVTPLVMCPTEYNKSWSNVEKGYLPTLGDNLNPTVEVMWTGDRVIACIDKQTMDWINPLIKRKAYIWWNFPVSDYVRNHLLLGPTYGNTADIKEDMSGFVANPMERAEASKISLYSVADYTWNIEAYDSEASWHRALNHLMPLHTKELTTFASHNSDLGPNYHGFRRDESVILQPILEEVKGAYLKGEVNESFQALLEEIGRISNSSNKLLHSTEFTEFIEEVKPWLTQFGLLGEYGKQVMIMAATMAERGTMPDDLRKAPDAAGKKGAFEKAYDAATSLQKQMFDLDITENQNPYQPGVKVASKVLMPTLDELFSLSTTRYNKTYSSSLNTRAFFSPYSLVSNVPQLAALQMQSGRHAKVSPAYEGITWPAEAHLAITADSQMSVSRVNIDLSRPAISAHFTCEYLTAEGQWITLPLTQEEEKTLIRATLPANCMTTAIRLTNSSGKAQEIQLKRFEVEVK